MDGRFILIDRFGEKNKKAISIYVGTRTVRQIRSHMQKYQERLVRMIYLLTNRLI